MSADRNTDPRQFLAPSAPWVVDALAPTPAAQPAIGHHIGGAVEMGGSRSAPVFNPATGGTIGNVTLADAVVVGRAVAAAKAALPAWSDTPPLKRARIMFRFKQLLDERFDELAALITRE